MKYAIYTENVFPWKFVFEIKNDSDIGITYLSIRLLITDSLL